MYTIPCTLCLPYWLGCRIHRLLLYIEERPLLLVCHGYHTKRSDDEVPLMLDL